METFNYKVKILSRGKWIPDPFSMIVRTVNDGVDTWGLFNPGSRKFIKHLTYSEANEYFLNPKTHKAYGEPKANGTIFFTPPYPEAFTP